MIYSTAVQNNVSIILKILIIIYLKLNVLDKGFYICDLECLEGEEGFAFQLGASSDKLKGTLDSAAIILPHIFPRRFPSKENPRPLEIIRQRNCHIPFLSPQNKCTLDEYINPQ